MTTEILNNFNIETEQEEDGRWIAEIPELAGVLVYGDTENQAITKVKALALRVIADQIEHGEISLNYISFVAA
jgi:predicted RNase H-like HicB family nuclease